MCLRRLAPLSICFILCVAFAAAQTEKPPKDPASNIPASALIHPADLAAMLHGGSARPVILQVGFSVLYKEAHIPGAQYAGPTSRQDGVENLKSHVSSLPHSSLIVIYCGCCPWGRCPNVAPAYQQLQTLGFTNVKVLYLANNFGDDWVSKGYPVVRNNAVLRRVTPQSAL
jgi:thiosulfate/3-mercaptopyruvate sulfurtransferase